MFGQMDLQMASEELVDISSTCIKVTGLLQLPLYIDIYVSKPVLISFF